MLGDHDVGATLAVSDFEAAKTFYEGTLGLTAAMAMEGAAIYTSGSAQLLVYESEYAGTNKATALTFTVDDINGEVRTLKDKGIFFEHYDVEGLKSEGDIYSGENMKTAWFKDPDGNILSLFEGEMA